MSQQDTNDAAGQIILVAVYDDEAKAQRAIEQLRDKGVALAESLSAEWVAT
jgi:hypothetical protein